MTSFGTLQDYVAAAFDKTTLALDERDALHRFADQTRETFCRACGACEDASGGAPIADAMRCLMYENAYGDIHRAREAFRAIPVADRARLNHVDWTAAERACPHGLPIARLLDDAHRRLDV
jgi:predicted aldo/keto reductase-like oxidoreductase